MHFFVKKQFGQKQPIQKIWKCGRDLKKCTIYAHIFMENFDVEQLILNINIFF